MQHIDFVVNAMKRHCDQHQLLQHWKTDLDIDRQMLIDTQGWSAYCWIVSSTSSDLFPIGLHHRYDSMIKIVADCRVQSGAHVAWINPERAKSDGSYVIVQTDLKTVRKRLAESRPYQFTGSDRLQLQSPTGELIGRVKLASVPCEKAEDGCFVVYAIEVVRPGFPRGLFKYALHGELVERDGLFVKFQDASWDDPVFEPKPQKVRRYG